jgi:hypothetical protein
MHQCGVSNLRAIGSACDARIAELEDRDQRWVDQVCHYRNLAIMLGAKPEQMLSGHDRDLAAKWGEPSMHDGDWTMDDELAEVSECWEKLAAAEAQIAELQRELAIANRLIRRNVGALTESLKDDLDRLGDHQ